VKKLEKCERSIPATLEHREEIAAPAEHNHIPKEIIVAVNYGDPEAIHAFDSDDDSTFESPLNRIPNRR
jgi:hypothetical protein